MHPNYKISNLDEKFLWKIDFIINYPKKIVIINYKHYHTNYRVSNQNIYTITIKSIIINGIPYNR